MENKIEIKQSKDYLIVSFFGEVDSRICAKYRLEIDGHIQGNNQNVLFDFGQATMIDSSGIGLVLGRYTLLQQTNRKLVLCNLNKTAYKVFELTGIFKIMKYKENVRC